MNTYPFLGDIFVLLMVIELYERNLIMKYFPIVNKKMKVLYLGMVSMLDCLFLLDRISKQYIIIMRKYQI